MFTRTSERIAGAQAALRQVVTLVAKVPPVVLEQVRR
jgi:hypothetical protein